MGVRVRDGVCVHRGVLRQPRAAHVRAGDSGADASVDARAGADASPYAGAYARGVQRWFARLRPE